MKKLAATIASVLIGAGAASGAIAAVLASSAPDDGAAVQEGASEPLPPNELINYGE